MPIKAPVGGVAMGLIKEGDDYVVLTDIAGVEDHLGDMDFKVAGTSDGITALQMDIKITGVTFDILRDALSQAREVRMTILAKMHDAIPEPREQLSQYAPRISQIQIDTEKIGAVIGKGGETIRALSEEYDAQIDIDDDGTVRIYAQTGDLGDALVDRIRQMTKEVEVGDEFTGKVVKTTTFGAFVELAKGTDGLLHISNIAPGRRPDTVEEVLNRGDEAQGARGRGRPRARADRIALGVRPGGRRQVRRRAGVRGHRRQGSARRPRARERASPRRRPARRRPGPRPRSRSGPLPARRAVVRRQAVPVLAAADHSRPADSAAAPRRGVVLN